jgi:hypothetical protein
MSQAGVVTMKAMVQRLNRRLERDSKVLRSPRGDAASSDSLSSAEVASSSRRIGASLRKARAMPMRCRCPVTPTDRLMMGSGTWNITNPPPDLIQTEVATMIGSQLTV